MVRRRSTVEAGTPFACSSVSDRLSELPAADADRPRFWLNHAVQGDEAVRSRLGRRLVLEWRDAPVMHAQIETPAFAGVSVAGL
jgi:hypothetical protein